MCGLKSGRRLESRSEREKQEWENEKPKLDNARRLRGIYFIDPDDGDYKDIIRNDRRKLEVPMEAPMRCKKKREVKQAHRKRERKMTNPARFQKQNMLVLRKLPSPRDNVWNHLHLSIMMIIL